MKQHQTVLALDLGGTAIKAGLVTKAGKIEQWTQTPSQAKQGGERLLVTAMSVADQYHGYDAIGISTAGQVDVSTGTIVYANENIPHYTGMQIAQPFEQRYAVPVVVENDVNAAVWGEYQCGALQGCSDALCVTYGTGVGGGLLLHGALYRGVGGIAGELGHMVIHPDGRPCTCGQQGCYEQYASTNALLQRAQQLDPALRQGQEIFARAPFFQEVIDDWIQQISLGLVNLIHLLNPQAIALGGGVMEQPTLLPQIQRQVQDRLMPQYRAISLRAAQNGNRAGLLGVAVLAQQTLYRSSR